MSACQLNRNVRIDGVQGLLFLSGYRSRSVEGWRLNGQGADAYSTVSCRPTARFAGFGLWLSALSEIDDHPLHVGLRELARLLRAGQSVLAAYR